MDISKLSAEQRIIDIMHPKTGAELGIKVFLVAFESNDSAVKAAKRKYLDRKNWYKTRGKEMPANEEMHHDNDIFAACVVDWDWSGDANFNGEKPKFSRDNVIKVFEALPWFKKQVADEVNDLESFIAA